VSPARNHPFGVPVARLALRRVEVPVAHPAAFQFLEELAARARQAADARPAPAPVRA